MADLAIINESIRVPIYFFQDKQGIVHIDEESIYEEFGKAIEEVQANPDNYLDITPQVETKPKNGSIIEEIKVPIYFYKDEHIGYVVDTDSIYDELNSKIRRIKKNPYKYLEIEPIKPKRGLHNIKLISHNAKGWHKEPINHALASKGIKVGKSRTKR